MSVLVQYNSRNKQGLLYLTTLTDRFVSQRRTVFSVLYRRCILCVVVINFVVSRINLIEGYHKSTTELDQSSDESFTITIKY